MHFCILVRGEVGSVALLATVADSVAKDRGGTHAELVAVETYVQGRQKRIEYVYRVVEV